MKKIFVVSGLVDFQISGNQTIKQTVLYFSKYYDVSLYSLLNEDINQNLDKNFLQGQVKIYRLSKKISFFASFFKNLKNFINSKTQRKNKVNVEYDALGDYSESTKYFMSTVLLIAAIFDVPRIFFKALLEKPNIIYGYEVSGAITAAIVGKLLNIAVVKRYQGTPVPNLPLKTIHKSYYIYLFSMKIFNCPVVMADDGTFGDEILERLGISSYYFVRNGLVIEPLDDIIKNSNYEYSIEHPLKLVTVSKLKYWKRIDRSLELISHLVSTGVTNIHLDIVGDGEAFEFLKNKSKNLSLCPFVTFKGAKSHHDALVIMNEADVFMSFYDVSNMGNPLFEASYLGKPIITLNDKNTRNFFNSSVNLINLSSFHDDSLHMIKRLIHDITFFNEVHSISKNARTNLINWSDRIDKEVSWIESIL